MPLEPTEREEHFFKAMVDAADGSTPEELEPTERKEHWYKEIIDAIKAGGGGGSGGGVLVVTDTDGTLDASYQDIEDAGFFAVLHTQLSETATQVDALSMYAHGDNGYGVMFGEASYNAANKTDYLELPK